MFVDKCIPVVIDPLARLHVVVHVFHVHVGVHLHVRVHGHVVGWHERRRCIDFVVIPGLVPRHVPDFLTLVVQAVGCTVHAGWFDRCKIRPRRNRTMHWLLMADHLGWR